MATRGAKPKPVNLRLVDGTHRTTRHGKAETARKDAETVAAVFGKLTMPAGLKGEAAKAWKRYIVPAAWLDGAKEPAAIAFCELWSQFMESPSHFVAAKHGQLRAYMSELGLTDERNRGGSDDDHDPLFDN
jgi:phage terminase small subunit